MTVQHIMDRALERYGIVLTPGDVAQIKRKICVGDSVLLERRPNDGRESHLVALPNGTVVKAGWCPATMMVCTILPKYAKCSRGNPPVNRHKTKKMVTVDGDSLAALMNGRPRTWLTEATGLTDPTIRRWLAGGRTAIGDLIIAANAFRVPVSVLIKEENND